MAKQQIPEKVAEMFAADERIVQVTEYLDGFVPNSYKYRAPGKARYYRKGEDGAITVQEGGYDRKRSHGAGPWLVGFSAAGGRLASV